MGATMISNEEYKDLIFKEKELEETNDLYNRQLKENKVLEAEIVKLEQELKELILVVTDKKSRPSYGDGEFHSFDVADSSDIAKYITENYLGDDNFIKLRKIEKEVKEAHE